MAFEDEESNKVAEFFKELSEQPRMLSPAVETTLRFDLEVDHEVENWHLRISRGTVRVRREPLPADCVVRTSKATFVELVTGRANLVTLTSRNQLAGTGDLEVLATFRKFLPGPAEARDPRYTHPRLSLGGR
ncbi:SCP2 sterol-binding domain-containing protein [Micromonospora sp. NPDC051141]|uniref:SCP2 sterol-binding domain-containing protein n=1 Tax=Micromonospora sp. NPDC051141 TaxID=3364284 RepID=UPI0037A0B260